MDLGLNPIIEEIRKERDALRARVAELERECAGLAVVVAKFKATTHPRNIPFAPRLEGWDAFAALYQKYLLYLDHVHTDAGIVYASAIHDLLGSLPDPSAALARYRDGVLEEVLQEMKGSWFSDSVAVAEMIRAMKGAK